MKVSYNWLQKYFDEKLPEQKELADVLTRKAYEVESLIRLEPTAKADDQLGDDFVLDIDILPNRAHDSLSHLGVAREISILFELPLKKIEAKTFETSETQKLEVEIQDANLCRRYIGRRVEGVKVGPSPDWLKVHLETLGQKSINNIVDATNYVMLDLGQPLHAFDANKVSGEKIVVRTAKSEEKTTTLSGDDVTLGETNLVVADSEGPLAIAGVKGGKRAEVDQNTTSIILESANFNPVSVRKTARGLGILTDSSKRFENEPTAYLAESAMQAVTALILEIASTDGTTVGEVVDVFPTKPETYSVTVTLDRINARLGSQINEKEIEGLFGRFRWIYEKGNSNEYVITVPPERFDLRIAEDVIEEVGRVYGYDKIANALPETPEFTPELNREFYYTNLIRNTLRDLGFSEVYASSFSEKGEIEVENPMAEDKKYLRPSLSGHLQTSLIVNAHNAPLYGTDTIQIFEIGKVFGESERLSLAFGVNIAKKTKGKEKKEEEILESVRVTLTEKLGVDVAVVKESSDTGCLASVDLESLLETLPAPQTFGDTVAVSESEVTYKTISPYPFVTRDIALFVPENISQDQIETIINENATSLLVRAPKLFDRFQKPDDPRVSYAFGLVFQSDEKTLTDAEVNIIMKNITLKLEEHENWEVR